MVMFHRFRRGIVALLALMLIVIAFGLVTAQEATETPDTEQEAAYRESLIAVLDEAVNPGEFDRLDEFVAEDYVVHSPIGELDRDGLKGFLGALHNSLTDFNMRRDLILIDGDYAATVTVITGTFDQDFPTPNGMVPPNGQPITISMNLIFRFDEAGMIVEEWAQFDNLGFLTQLGAMGSGA